MRLPTPPTQGPSRGLPRTSGSLSIAALRILASPLGESASPAISGTTFERSRMRPFESRIPGFSRPLGPKRTSFMDSPWGFEASWRREVPGPPMMRRVLSRGKEAAHPITVPHRRVAPSIAVAYGQQMRGYRPSTPIYAAFSFAMGAVRGQISVMHLVRAPSCKRRGFRGRHDGKSSPQGFAGLSGLIGGCDGAGSAGLVRVWGMPRQ